MKNKTTIYKDSHNWTNNYISQQRFNTLITCLNLTSAIEKKEK